MVNNSDFKTVKTSINRPTSPNPTPYAAMQQHQSHKNSFGTWNLQVKGTFGPLPWGKPKPGHQQYLELHRPKNYASPYGPWLGEAVPGRRFGFCSHWYHQIYPSPRYNLHSPYPHCLPIPTSPPPFHFCSALPHRILVSHHTIFVDLLVRR